MNITIQTYRGTYIVPADKQEQLIAWLEQHAVNVSQQKITEVENDINHSRFLINETN